VRFLAKLLAPSVLPWIVSALVGAGGFAWFKLHYVPRSEAASAVEAVTRDLSAARLEIDALNEMVFNAGVRLHELNEANERELARNRVLNEKWDQIRERLREIDDEQSKDWRLDPVPDPVASGLRDADTGS